jgi:hypothetical protein
MAKENTNLDQFFREKLNQDSITPSKLAWERLESQLSQQEKSKTPLMWWAVAASITVLFVAGYFTFKLSSTPDVNPILVSSQGNQVEEVIGESIEISPENPEEISVEAVEKFSSQKENLAKPTSPSTQKKSVPNKVNSPTNNLIAAAEEKLEMKNTEKTIETNSSLNDLELPPLKLPNLHINQTVAEQTKAEDSGYRVKIYSDGLDEDKNLISGISKKVDKVEGLLGKVDQGFADLQDAKSNLFNTLLSKKEKSAEKP